MSGTLFEAKRDRRSTRQGDLRLETLEDRCLLANNIAYDAVSKVVTITGTPTADHAYIRVVGSQVVVTLKDIASDTILDERSFAPASVKKFVSLGGDGDDVLINDSTTKVVAYGGGANDYLEGGLGGDKLFGGDGDDILVGFKGSDKLYGEIGTDMLFGMQGKDLLDGGVGDDGLFGGAGSNQLADNLGQNTLDPLTDGDLRTIYEPYGSAKLADYFNNSGGQDELSQIEREIFNLLNQERTSRGLAPLSLNSSLISAAQHHATNMASMNRMAHDLPGADLPTLLDRLRYYRYNYRNAGENIAYGYQSAQSVMNAWMNSSGHRSNILSPNFTEVGIGVRYSSGGTPYYCQVFGRPA